MGDDIRVRTGFFTHPKTKALIRRMGYEGPFRLMALWGFARENKPDGDLRGMSDDAIADGASWNGPTDDLLSALTSTGWIDGAPGERKLHDWAEHNPHSVGQRMRDLKARWNATSRHHGKAEADRRFPEYAAYLASIGKGSASSTADSSAAISLPAVHAGVPTGLHSAVQTEMPPAMLLHTPHTTPHPGPKKEDAPATGADSAGDDGAGSKPKKKIPDWARLSFDVWYQHYPSKVGRELAERAWLTRLKNLGVGREHAMRYAESVKQNVLQRVAEDDRWLGGYIPNPATYINQGRCDEDPVTFSRKAQDQRRRELANEAAALAAASSGHGVGHDR